MRRLILILMCIALIHKGYGQYTYFNHVFGSTDDQSSQFDTCIELIDSIWYTWGGGVDGPFFNSVSTYSSSGIFQDDAIWTFPQSLIYLGETNSFQKIPGENAFLFSQAIEDVNGSHGLLMKVDSNLDTLWTSILDIYIGQTSVITHAWDGDGFILAGEHQVAGVGNGTFIAKVDTEGQYLWHTVLHEPDEGSYRNRYISSIGNGYILSGSEGGGLDTEGVVEFYNSDTEELLSLSTNGSAILRGIMEHTVKDNGEIIVTQSSLVQDYPGASDPIFAYCRQRIYELDIENEGLVLLNEYFQDNSLITGGVVKTIESSANPLVMLGQGHTEVDGTLNDMSFVMALDDNYEMSWHTQLSYELCPGCTNELYDIEQAPDGGYVMVGKFNSPEDPYDKTWLVKVDACGDLVWQGCDPVGIQEFQIQSRNDGMKLEIYPNPARDLVRVLTPSGVGVSAGWQSLSLYDVTGKVVKELSDDRFTQSNDEVTLDVSDLPSGLYSIALTTAYGRVFSSKLVVE